MECTSIHKDKYSFLTNIEERLRNGVTAAKDQIELSRDLRCLDILCNQYGFGNYVDYKLNEYKFEHITDYVFFINTDEESMIERVAYMTGTLYAVIDILRNLVIRNDT